MAAAIILCDLVLVFGFAHWRLNIPKADAVIVLGAAINTPALYNRTLEGLHLYEQGKADVMVLSGGKIAEADISEAQYMQKVIKSNITPGGPPPVLILEDQSHNTFENIHNSLQQLGEKKDVIIVSDQFHLARAVLIAKRAGFRHVYWSAPWPTYFSVQELRYYYVRELTAMITYLPKFIKG